MMSTSIATPSQDRMAPVPADAFVVALCDRKFDALGRLLASDVQMRAVLPSRYLEAAGDEVVGWFTRWFGTSEQFEVIDAGSGNIAGKARAHWRFQVAPHPITGGPGWHEIEQVAFCETAAGSISRIDLVCSGFRALPLSCAACDG